VTGLRQFEERTKELAPPPIREAGKRALHAFGMLTAPLRPVPEFMIIGTKRGGTTSLFNYLLQHPDVVPLYPVMENRKGAHYFDTNYHKGSAWYRSHFPTVLSRSVRARGDRGILAGEASPYYLFHPHAARRARRQVPNGKLIVLLRNPVDRAYSHFKERRRNGDETLTFEEALEREPERLAGELARMERDPTYVSFAHEHFSYVSQGIYLPQLRAWLDHFPQDQFLILRSEDMFDDPPATFAAVLRFLGLPPIDLAHFQRFNYHTSEDVDSLTRERLAATFEPHNRSLEEFLGRDMKWD
jgi:hypothetical protein